MGTDCCHRAYTHIEAESPIIRRVVAASRATVLNNTGINFGLGGAEEEVTRVEGGGGVGVGLSTSSTMIASIDHTATVPSAAAIVETTEEPVIEAVEAVDETPLEKLTAMGLGPREMCERALEMAGGDQNAAAEILLSEGDGVGSAAPVTTGSGRGEQGQGPSS